MPKQLTQKEGNGSENCSLPEAHDDLRETLAELFDADNTLDREEPCSK
jgi:hypothetical protein